MKARNIVVGVSLGLAVIGCLIALSIPVPADWTKGALSFYWPLVASFMFSPIDIGAVVLFLMGASAYKARLRIAYVGIVLSVALATVGVSQIAIINAFNLLDSAWVKLGGLTLPFLFSGIAAYCGVRSMARQVGVRSIWTRFLFAVPVVGVLIAGSIFLPHAATSIPEKYFDISNGVITWDIGIYAICTIIALQVSRHIGQHYTRAMAWLALSYGWGTVLTLTVLTALLTGNPVINHIGDVTVVIGAILYLKAGYEFVKTKEL